MGLPSQAGARFKKNTDVSCGCRWLSSEFRIQDKHEAGAFADDQGIEMRVGRVGRVGRGPRGPLGRPFF